jgi:hypothetical protein
MVDDEKDRLPPTTRSGSLGFCRNETDPLLDSCHLLKKTMAVLVNQLPKHKCSGGKRVRRKECERRPGSTFTPFTKRRYVGWPDAIPSQTQRWERAVPLDSEDVLRGNRLATNRYPPIMTTDRQKLEPIRKTTRISKYGNDFAATRNTIRPAVTELIMTGRGNMLSLSSSTTTYHAPFPTLRWTIASSETPIVNWPT